MADWETNCELGNQVLRTADWSAAKVEKLKQRDRIPIERDPQLRHGRDIEALHKIAAHPRKLAGMLGLQEYVPPPPALDPLDGTWGRPDHHHFVSSTGGDQLAQPLASMDRKLGGELFHESAEDDVRESNIRRITRISTANHFVANK